MRTHLRILTCNVRIPIDGGDDAWLSRRARCARVIASRAPDVICFQELHHAPAADLAAALPGYARYGAEDAPVGGHPVDSVFWRADRFDALSMSSYWLSERPQAPGSASWGSAAIRLASWVRLRDRATGVRLRVISTHFDHVSQPARERQAGVIAEEAAAWPADHAQILAGDFNVDAANPAYARLIAAGWRDTWSAVNGPADPGPTYHGFLGERAPDGTSGGIGKIDFVLTRGPCEPLASEIVRDHDGGRYPSDHYFVAADVAVAEA